MHEKGPISQKHDGSGLRIGIIHSRWNWNIIEPLLEGTKAKLLESGVAESNIVVESVPGAWELPVAVQRFFDASQVQSANSANSLSAGDLLLGGSTTDLSAPAPSSGSSSTKSTLQFDALVAIGVLIKGETMHFEYIADSVSQGLMRVQLDTGVPVIFGVLTVLSEKQGLARAGVIEGSHNHGEDWGSAAVEMAVKRKAWSAGKLN
ncbi:6,7-dimethyl-8-ribityllumazine synthase [Sporothrix schenckii 1099-18]|uniref:6,7-dimethyl-8-ribityllumazine synthase n=2 Tax=Sporothrix schenckii TaxID=29908 RepID=U7Q263_SPOS1|nr:6,7-dimethyl-8-ribityllumazine synthase [Sporothrix schenckii 1099-18]ERT01287.1 6,7-dimethyl-8-ribityllumazine synthase [Sporothrix schenckii ATCC 58251]KJR88455.1 6,7-dimethyl-8-ribityllumazine synthase [Sporothrix schenckii 1099-18]